MIVYRAWRDGANAMTYREAARARAGTRRLVGDEAGPLGHVKCIGASGWMAYPHPISLRSSGPYASLSKAAAALKRRVRS